jgi:transposase
MACLDQVATVEAIEKHIHAWHRFCEESRRLEEIPGIGPIVATALVAEGGGLECILVGPQSRRLDRIGTQTAFDRRQREDSAGSLSRAIDICAGCSSPDIDWHRPGLLCVRLPCRVSIRKLSRNQTRSA